MFNADRLLHHSRVIKKKNLPASRKSWTNDLPITSNLAMWSGSEEGSYLRLVDRFITQL